MNHQKLSVGLWKFRKRNDYSWSRALANKCFRFVCERLADWCFRTYRRWIKGRPASVGGCTTSFCRRLYARCAWRTNVPQLSTIVPHHWPITFCFAFDATWVHSKNWNVHSRRTKGTTHTHTHTPVVYAFILHFTRAHSLSLSSSHAELCSLHRLPATDMRNASARDISTLCDTRFGVSCCSTTSTAARCQWIRTSTMP